MLQLLHCCWTMSPLCKQLHHLFQSLFLQRYVGVQSTTVWEMPIVWSVSVYCLQDHSLLSASALHLIAELIDHQCHSNISVGIHSDHHVIHVQWVISSDLHTVHPFSCLAAWFTLVHRFVMQSYPQMSKYSCTDRKNAAVCSTGVPFWHCPGCALSYSNTALTACPSRRWQLSGEHRCTSLLCI